jgi:S-adenosylmethionine decarboxylase
MMLAGKHMTIDGVVADSSSLREDSLVRLLDLLVEELGMEYLHRPVVCSVPIAPEKLETEEDEGGLSCFCQITTSHIAVHSWPLKLGFMMDVFSCRDFDVERARAIVYKALGVVEARVSVHERKGPSGRQAN